MCGGCEGCVCIMDYHSNLYSLRYDVLTHKSPQCYSLEHLRAMYAIDNLAQKLQDSHFVHDIY